MPRFQTARKHKYFVKKPVENRKRVMGVQSNNKKGTEVTGGPLGVGSVAGLEATVAVGRTSYQPSHEKAIRIDNVLFEKSLMNFWG